jgi:hypothetical protein
MKLAQTLVTAKENVNFMAYKLMARTPLWSSGQILVQIFLVVLGLERGPLRHVGINELLVTKSSSSSLEI